jgi:hypothetical protein
MLDSRALLIGALAASIRKSGRYRLEKRRSSTALDGSDARDHETYVIDASIDEQGRFSATREHWDHIFGTTLIERIGIPAANVLYRRVSATSTTGIMTEYTTVPPPDERWERLLLDAHPDEAISSQIFRLIEIEGARLFVANSDVVVTMADLPDGGRRFEAAACAKVLARHTRKVLEAAGITISANYEFEFAANGELRLVRSKVTKIGKKKIQLETTTTAIFGAPAAICVPVASECYPPRPDPQMRVMAVAPSGQTIIVSGQVAGERVQVDIPLRTADPFARPLPGFAPGDHWVISAYRPLRRTEEILSFMDKEEKALHDPHLPFIECLSLSRDGIAAPLVVWDDPPEAEISGLLEIETAHASDSLYLVRAQTSAGEQYDIEWNAYDLEHSPPPPGADILADYVWQGGRLILNGVRDANSKEALWGYRMTPLVE